MSGLIVYLNFVCSKVRETRWLVRTMAVVLPKVLRAGTGQRREAAFGASFGVGVSKETKNPRSIAASRVYGFSRNRVEYFLVRGPEWKSSRKPFPDMTTSHGCIA
ncbi:hypothetical protein [Paraburkholderia sediminicola]|uniref:hypothetical protein n=1 Tax=Paraburkholderia sediminicola TaxID=458836 RepID=UPI0038B729C3